MTIKECFHVAGTQSTIGVERFVGELAAEDSPLVRRWQRAGAIVLGKTNVPQLMILHETDNPVYGRTNNPWNLDRGPGGSSGGEAAIVAAGGSALGLASDLGGSIRQPAHSCGICGLLPTIGRIEVSGKRGNFAGMEASVCSPGRWDDRLPTSSWACEHFAMQRETAKIRALGPLPSATRGRSTSGDCGSG